MITKFVVGILNNSVGLGILGFSLVMLPIMGIAKIHDTKNGSDKTRASSDTERVSGND